MDKIVALFELDIARSEAEKIVRKHSRHVGNWPSDYPLRYFDIWAVDAIVELVRLHK